MKQRVLSNCERVCDCPFIKLEIQRLRTGKSVGHVEWKWRIIVQGRCIHDRTSSMNSLQELKTSFRGILCDIKQVVLGGMSKSLELFVCPTIYFSGTQFWSSGPHPSQSTRYSSLPSINMIARCYWQYNHQCHGWPSMSRGSGSLTGGTASARSSGVTGLSWQTWNVEFGQECQE